MVKKFTLLLHLLFRFSFILCVNSFNPGISKSQQRWLGLGTQGQTPVICSLRRVGGFSANCSLILPFSALTSQLVLLLWGCLSYWLPWIYHCYVYPSFTLHKGLSMYQLIPLHKQPVNLRRVMVCPKINSLQVNSRVSLVRMHHGPLNTDTWQGNYRLTSQTHLNGRAGPRKHVSFQPWTLCLSLIV